MSRRKERPRTGAGNVTEPSAPTLASAPLSRTTLGIRPTNPGPTSRSRFTVAGLRVVHAMNAGRRGIH
jgi:hypothetical protein